LGSWCQPFGFRPDARDYVEVDPEQWSFVERIHGDHATLDPLGGGSIRRLRRHLVAMGWALWRSSSASSAARCT
jgi:hypothetical protein